VGGWTVCRQVESRSACLARGLPRGRSVLDRFDRCGILMILTTRIRTPCSVANRHRQCKSISSFGVAKVNFFSERTLSCIDSDNAREETHTVIVY
jgi:hypothetical protein